MTYRTVVIGSGVAALVTALVAAESGPVLLLVRRGFQKGIPVRTDSLPVGALAALIELGLDPRLFSDLRRHTERLVAWGRVEPTLLAGPETVHVERGNLEAALYERLIGHPTVTLLPSPTRKAALIASANQYSSEGTLVVDATGRAAVLAHRKRVPARPWYAWTIRVRAAHRQSFDGGFRIAALTHGYGYRLGTASGGTLGIVTPDRGGSRNAVARFESLRAECPWLLDGMPRFEFASAASVFSSSVQETAHRGLIAVGDAALARDALSSQGLACAISDARHAAAVDSSTDRHLYEHRAREQQARHLRALVGVVKECRFAASPSWAEYLGDLVAMERTEVLDSRGKVALRDGRLGWVSTAPTQLTA